MPASINSKTGLEFTGKLTVWGDMHWIKFFKAKIA